MTTNRGGQLDRREADSVCKATRWIRDICARSPIHWDGNNACFFSMVVGAPVAPTDSSTFVWPLYRDENLDAVDFSNTNSISNRSRSDSDCEL